MGEKNGLRALARACAGLGATALVGRLMPAVLGPQRDLGSEELGPYLGGGGDVRVREMSPGLTEHEGGVLEWDRAEEADRTWRWLHGQSVAIEDVFATSDDGTRLAGHVLACCPGSPRWLVFAHGYHDNWRAGLTYARRFAEAGYNLLFCDLRAHGASGGDWVGCGWLDRRDLVAWSHWVLGRAGEGARIALMGISMGAASCLMASGEQDLPSQVRACVADSGYSDFWRTAENVVSTGSLGTPPVAAHPLLDVARRRLMRAPGGYDLRAARPVEALARTRVPVLLLHGEGDRVVPVEMAHELAGTGTGHELVAFPGAGHCCAVFADPERYWDAVLGFVCRWT
ncbi:alpha/beta hydrolase [Thermophilibacter provencensis]|uniref:CocE/NonD family hydrolase n=1 Tax=Thermophilibacter provencensis TaxID=1852386 RepID=A0ABT7V396_9ACTN|nr:alpha/beta fold hydrolase [Thermophilibacter provencensis]MDM8271077.1 CocE/NonD family hydrolase [Thermophilibacter provencensis]